MFNQQLKINESPSVTLHKGGGKIIVAPNDIVSAAVWYEIKERINRPVIMLPYSTEEIRASIYNSMTPEDLQNSMRAWTLVNTKPKDHLLYKILKAYNVQVVISPSLAGWLAKQKRALKREATPFLLPEYKDERPLFEKVEAGMVLTCSNDFSFDKKKIFHKGNKYQIVDTARSTSEDGVVKLCTSHVTVNSKISLFGSNEFSWTVFQPPMEDHFACEEKIIFDPNKCLPNQYPELISYHRKKLDKLNLKLYEHVKQDVAQEAIKSCTLNGKLLRMGKSSEAIATAMLWESKRVGIVGPKNARIFTRKEFERLGIKDYVVVDSIADFAKPGKYYLLTYSWLKSETYKYLHKTRYNNINRSMAENKKLYKDRRSFLYFEKTEKKVVKIVEHFCPHCKHALERYSIKKLKAPSGLFDTIVKEWTTERGYLCRNTKCKPVVQNNLKNGIAWGYKTDTDGNTVRVSPVTLGAKSSLGHIGHIDWSLKFHKDCKKSHIKGKLCTECGQADSVRLAPIYKNKVVKENGKKVKVKDFFTGVIIDEIHNIKSADSDIGKVTRTLRAKRRMGLSGTLMPNTPSDAYWPLHWVFKGGSALFPYHQKKGAAEFYTRFCEYVSIKRGNGLANSYKMLPYLKNPIAFWELMAPKMVRRNYEDPLVISSLKEAGRHYPTIEFHRIEPPMHALQAALTVASLNKFEATFNEYLDTVQQTGHLVNQAMVLGQMAHMRMAATCPEYFNRKLAELKPPKPPIYHGPLGGGKMHEIKNIVLNKTLAGEKVVILSGFVEMRRSLAIELESYNPIVFDSSWDDSEREDAFQSFFDDPERKVFIAGTLQIREGINLAAANTVICCDLLWQPGLQQQAWSRIFTPTEEARICHVYILLSKFSVDGHIYNSFYTKVAAAEQALDRKVINKRANQVDIRWFVDRILEDRDKIMNYINSSKEEGIQDIMVQETKLIELVDRLI